MAAKASVELPRKYILQNCCGHAFGKRRYVYFSKKEKNRCIMLEDFKVPNEIQP